MKRLKGMNHIMKYIFVLLLGFLLSGAWFGCQILLQKFIHKKNLEHIKMLTPLFSAFIPTCIIYISLKNHPFHIEKLGSLQLWLITILTVCVTCFIIKSLKTGTQKSENVKSLCVEAALMELPQRAMMQTFVCVLSTAFLGDSIYGFLITACVWCMGIVVQAIICKQNINKELVIEIIASFVFSLGIGYVFYASQCLLFGMVAHALERFVVTKQR
jgi:hypothetical protein